MSTQRYDAFVSAVTSECGKARDAVATDLRKLGLRVAVQSDLRHDPAEVSLLQALHDTIQDCDEMHCLIGRRSGDVPSAESAAPFGSFLPDDMPEASYAQWEYFFARHHLPEQTWLYRTEETYQPDDQAPAGEDRPDLQLRFLDHLRWRNDRYVRFATVDGARAEVALVRRGHGHAGEAHSGGHAAAHEPLSRGIAANAIGSFVAGVLLSALPLLFAQLGGGVALVLLLLVPALLLGGVGFVAFFMMYRRYETILTWRGADARAAYAALRQSLTEGGVAAQIYAHRLRRALAAVDRFFGDADMADHTLFPRAFRLKQRWPLWTAPAFERSLLLAFLYPVATMLLFWAISGHVGAAEHALQLAEGPAVQRIAALVALAAGVFGGCSFVLASERPRQLCVVGAVVVAGGCALVGDGAFTGTFLGSGAAAIPAATVFIAFTAGYIANLIKESELLAVPYLATLLVVMTADTVLLAAGIGQTVGMAVSLGFFAVAFPANMRLARLAIDRGWHGKLLIGLLLTCLVASLIDGAASGGAALKMGREPMAGPIVLFLGLLTLINAPFDWAALGLTRALLRRGLELGGWYPYLLAAIDALIAAVVIALLTIFSVLGVQAFDDLAAHAGGARARILPLDQLFGGIAANPSAPQYWWAYAMLFSTMIPSLLNLMIGGASLLRGVPWLNTALLRAMPLQRPPRSFDRDWIAAVLTGQVFLGGLLGIAAQAALVYLVIGLLLPVFGLDLLGLARVVAAPDLPGTLVAWLLGPPAH